jgi:2-aminoadipate transaminase
MPDGATWSHPDGGYFIWLDLPDEAPALADAERAGVTFVPGTDFFADGSGAQSLRLAFSFVSPDEIADGVARLAAVLAGSPAPASL